MAFWKSAAPAVSNPPEEEANPMATLRRDELPKSLGGTSDMLLGPGAEFDGKLTFKGTVRIDARFTGTIVTSDVLVVGEHARIDAEITCGSIIVHGEVNGNVKAKDAVELHQSARVRGNVETPSVSIEKGAVLHGELKMEAAKEGVRPIAAPPTISAVN
jgi:cytoskeletal protein CcmA (bactofilin family)